MKMRVDKTKGEDGYDILAKLVKEWLDNFEKENGYILWGPYYIYFRHKYDCEENFGCLNCVYLEYDYECDTWIWAYDFDEGQDEYRLVGITPAEYLREIEPVYKTEEEE